MGNNQEVLDHYNTALEIDNELNDRVGMAKEYANIGFVLKGLKKNIEAMDSVNNDLNILLKRIRVAIIIL